RGDFGGAGRIGSPAAGVGSRRVQGLQPRGENFGEQFNEFFRGAAVGIFLGVVLSHVKAEQIFVLGKFREGCAHVLEAQSAAAGHVDGGKVFLGDRVGIEMKYKIVSLGVHV